MGFLIRQAWCRPAQGLVLLFAPIVYLPHSWPWAAALLVVAGTVFWKLGKAPLDALALTAALLALLWGLRTSLPVPDAWPFAPEGTLVGTGTVVAEAPVTRKGTVPFRLRADQVRRGDWWGTADVTVTVVGYRGPSPFTGSRWTWRGKLLPGNLLAWSGGRQTGWTAWGWSVRASAREALTEHLQLLGPGPAALAEALLIGATDDLTPWEKDSFRLAGCSHVLALSGMHLSLLALVLTAVFQRRAPPWAVFGGVQVILALFCLLAGPIPSLWRAWVMAFLGGWWALTGRPVPLRELLAQSFIASVLFWPDMAGSLSLQLSFLAMAGLFLWSQPWERALRPYVGRWGAANLGPSLAAMAATAPLILGLFGEVRWIGLVMTPPLVFLTTVYLAGGLAVAVAGPLLAMVPGGPQVLAAAFGALYQAIFTCTAWASQFPALGAGVVVALGTGGLGGTTVFLYNKRHRKVRLPVHLNYDSPASLQAFLDQKGYAALKRWGQNFLINAGARKQILDALDLVPGEPVWEVGPGLGALTHHLVEAGHPLTVFEIDPGYVAFLSEEFGAAPGFRVVSGDVVKTWKDQPRPTKVVGNLPYNAASAIVADFIEGGFHPAAFLVTVQLEMAQRMAAPVGTKNRSSFSVLCQSAFTVRDVVTLKPGSFYPAPEVTSRVVKLQAHGKYSGLDSHRFSVFVRECYSSRRKTLRNNLPGAASALKVSDDRLTAAFAAVGVDLGRRAETLSVDEFVAVFSDLSRA